MSEIQCPMCKYRHDIETAENIDSMIKLKVNDRMIAMLRKLADDLEGGVL